LPAGTRQDAGENSFGLLFMLHYQYLAVSVIRSRGATAIYLGRR
jgi:hypothetical protein